MRLIINIFHSLLDLGDSKCWIKNKQNGDVLPLCLLAAERGRRRGFECTGLSQTRRETMKGIN